MSNSVYSCPSWRNLHLKPVESSWSSLYQEILGCGLPDITAQKRAGLPDCTVTGWSSCRTWGGSGARRQCQETAHEGEPRRMADRRQLSTHLFQDGYVSRSTKPRHCDICTCLRISEYFFLHDKRFFFLSRKGNNFRKLFFESFVRGAERCKAPKYFVIILGHWWCTPLDS